MPPLASAIIWSILALRRLVVPLLLEDTLQVRGLVGTVVLTLDLCLAGVAPHGQTPTALDRYLRIAVQAIGKAQGHKAILAHVPIQQVGLLRGRVEAVPVRPLHHPSAHAEILPRSRFTTPPTCGRESTG